MYGGYRRRQLVDAAPKRARAEEGRNDRQRGEGDDQPDKSDRDQLPVLGQAT
jgi:hypothetical protein